MLQLIAQLGLASLLRALLPRNDAIEFIFNPHRPPCAVFRFLCRRQRCAARRRRRARRRRHRVASRRCRVARRAHAGDGRPQRAASSRRAGAARRRRLLRNTRRYAVARRSCAHCHRRRAADAAHSHDAVHDALCRAAHSPLAARLASLLATAVRHSSPHLSLFDDVIIRSSPPLAPRSTATNAPPPPPLVCLFCSLLVSLVDFA